LGGTNRGSCGLHDLSLSPSLVVSMFVFGLSTGKRNRSTTRGLEIAHACFFCIPCYDRTPGRRASLKPARGKPQVLGYSSFESRLLRFLSYSDLRMPILHGNPLEYAKPRLDASTRSRLISSLLHSNSLGYIREDIKEL
jgi:hypothetical protein